MKKAFGIAPLMHLLYPLSIKLHRVAVCQSADKTVEGKFLFRFLGHDLFVVCSKRSQ